MRYNSILPGKRRPYQTVEVCLIIIRLKSPFTINFYNRLSIKMLHYLDQSINHDYHKERYSDENGIIY